MNIDDLVELIESSNVNDYGIKNWEQQPSFFESVFNKINLDKSSDLLFLELGVFSGHTLSIISSLTKDIEVYGFDTFDGLPEDWVDGDGNTLYPKNSFSTAKPEDTKKNKYIEGDVEKTLLPFLKEQNKKVKFVHFDLDLYAPSKFSLNSLYDWLDDESFLVLDDVYAYPGWEEHTLKALADTIDLNRFNIEFLSTCGWTSGWASLAIKLSKREASELLSMTVKELKGLLRERGLPVSGAKRALIERLSEKEEVQETPEEETPEEEAQESNVTIVTGLWDMGRGDVDGWCKRDFEDYKRNFLELLKSDVQMCIWIPEELKEEVLNVRGDKPTRIFIKELKDFEGWNPFFDRIQEIRNDEGWFNSAGWLKDSPQAKLEYYNAMMFTKMFMVNDSAITNPFETDYFFWIDGGLSSTVPSGYFTHDNVLNNLDNYIESHEGKFLQISYPYAANEEIHGFNREGMAKYCGVEFVENISRGGFWGGHKDHVRKINGLYYEILEATLKEGYMGADECLFTILAHRHRDLIKTFEVEGNGLIWPFFEELKDYKDKVSKVALYVITFNFPEQLRYLLDSYDGTDFLNKTEKYLIDNSTDESTFGEFEEICKEYGFERIKQDNIGICGGRQYAAEHFENSDCKYMIFLEDDMLLNPRDEKCNFGFPSKIDNLFKNVVSIMDKEKYDFLKFSFSEFYGTNSEQWAWYNVPQGIREEEWPKNNNLPQQGTSNTCPKTNFKNIKSTNGLPYADGEVYYSNWPQIVSRDGSKKMFLETKWDYPYEQTWMSNAFQLSKKGELHSAILLASPIFHDRKFFYEAKERVESKPFILEKDS